MEQHLILRPIGTVRADGEGAYLQLEPEFRPGLTGLEGFGAVQVLWWFSGCDSRKARGRLLLQRPYTRGPETLGVFATRSPERPNPLALSCAQVTWLDAAAGRLGLAYLDAEPGSPVLDLKPYIPSLDRVARPAVPDWCAHWPQDVERSGDFDWAAEFSP